MNRIYRKGYPLSIITVLISLTIWPRQVSGGLLMRLYQIIELILNHIYRKGVQISKKKTKMMLEIS